MKTFPRAVAYVGCAIFALTTAALAQDSEPKDVAVQVRHDSKEAPVTQLEQSPVQFLLETGYLSEYNFRGTNLMPGSEGAYFYDVFATVPKVGPGSLSFGVYGIHQLGTASVAAWSIGEGGGGGSGAAPLAGLAGFAAERFPTTTQTSFREIDVYASYKFSMGPVDITFGNVVFLIHREATTFERDVALPPFPFWRNAPPGCIAEACNDTITAGPFPTVQDETFDRIYIELSTSRIPHFTPSITYYQTLYNEGVQQTGNVVIVPPFDQFGLPNPNPGPNVVVFDEFGNRQLRPAPGNERNDELGGYLRARLDGHFPVARWLDVNARAEISYSFRDRTDPVSDPSNPYAGVPLTGLNNTLAGLELVFHVTPNIAIVPSVAYSYHISDPPVGTDRNEVWAGAKVVVNLP